MALGPGKSKLTGPTDVVLGEGCFLLVDGHLLTSGGAGELAAASCKGTASTGEALPRDLIASPAS